MNSKRAWMVLLLLVSTIAVAQQTSNQEKQSPQLETAKFSVQDANDVLAKLREGLEAHSQRKFLAVFDADKMDAYVSFQDGLQAFFTHYENFRVNIHSIQVSALDDKGAVIATFQMEATPRNGNPLRREGQLRLELEHSAKGWRIVSLNPRNFFS
jgi:hypothetical protein